MVPYRRPALSGGTGKLPPGRWQLEWAGWSHRCDARGRVCGVRLGQ